jgi:hypothetical protein
VLRRGIFVQRAPDGTLLDLREECSAVEWREGRSLTVREVRRKDGKSKGKGKGKKGERVGGEEAVAPAAARKKYKACVSLFRCGAGRGRGGLRRGVCSACRQQRQPVGPGDLACSRAASS